LKIFLEKPCSGSFWMKGPLWKNLIKLYSTIKASHVETSPVIFQKIRKEISLAITVKKNSKRFQIMSTYHFKNDLIYAKRFQFISEILQIDFKISQSLQSMANSQSMPNFIKKMTIYVKIFQHFLISKFWKNRFFVKYDLGFRNDFYLSYFFLINSDLLERKTISKNSSFFATVCATVWQQKRNQTIENVANFIQKMAIHPLFISDYLKTKIFLDKYDLEIIFHYN